MAEPKAPLTGELNVRLAPQTAATPADTSGPDAPYAATVTGATLTPDAAITGATATKRTFTVVNRGQTGAGTTVVATLDLITGVNPPKSDETPFTLSAVAGATTLAAGDVLAVVEAVTSTGIANPGANVEITLSRT